MSLRARALVVMALVGAAFGATGVAAARPAMAHPLGNFTVNRYGGLVLAPGSVRLHYVLDMAEIPTFQEGPRIDANGDGAQAPSEQEAWARAKAASLLAGVRLVVGGAEVPLRVDRFALSFPEGQAGLPTLRLVVDATGALPDTGSLTFEDRNYADRIGWKEITVRSEPGVSVAASVPSGSVSDELRAYPKDLLSSPLDVRSASASFRPGVGAPSSTSARSSDRVSGAPIASGGSFARLVTWKLTPLVLAVSLILAVAFGALHALGPGHGKTITAAYLVASGARIRQAAAVGAAVALMHTASVLTLGLVLFVLARTFPPDRVYPWLTLATGLVALGLGAALFVSRARRLRRAEPAGHGHTHPWDEPPTSAAFPRPLHVGHPRPGLEAGRATASAVLLLEREDASAAGNQDEERSQGHDLERGHRDDHDHDHRHDHQAARPLSRRGLVALAVAGGILPSPTAFVVLTGAVSAHRIGYGLALIAAFSAGLAASLMIVGMIAVRARVAVARRLGSRLAAILPVISALVIAGFGVFFSVQGLAVL